MSLARTILAGENTWDLGTGNTLVSRGMIYNAANGNPSGGWAIGAYYRPVGNYNINLVGNGTVQFNSTGGGYSGDQVAYVNGDLNIGPNVTVTLGRGVQWREWSTFTGSGHLGLRGSGALTTGDAVTNSFWITGTNVTTFSGMIGGHVRLSLASVGGLRYTGTSFLTDQRPQFLYGTLELDHTSTAASFLRNTWNIVTQPYVGFDYNGPGLFTLQIDGHPSITTTETVSQFSGRADVSGMPVLVLKHGANASVTFAAGNTGISLDGNDRVSVSLMRFEARDSSGALDVLGATNGNYCQVTIANNTYTFNGAATVLDAGGLDFATYVNNVVSDGIVKKGIVRLPAGTRAMDINSAGASTDLIIGGGGQTLGGAKTINSLKFADGSGLDLGGNTLKLAGTVSYSGAGILQTGSDNPTGITHGALDLNNRNLSIHADKDLYIGSDVTFTNMRLGVAKDGNGKLTFAAVLPGVISLGWYEGSLDYESATNATINSYINSDGSLTKGGVGTLTLSVPRWSPDKFMYRGGTTVNGGILKLSGDGNEGGVNWYGTGPITVNTGGTLLVAAQVANTAWTLNGGTLDMGANAVGIYGSGRETFADSNAVLTVLGPTTTVSTIRFSNWETNNASKSVGRIYRLTGGGTLVKTGSNPYTTLGGLLFRTLTGASSSFTGNIDIAEGVIKLENANSWPANVGVTTIRTNGLLWVTADTTIAKGTMGQTFAGGGRIVANTYFDANGAGTGTVRTLTLDGVQLAPGGGTNQGVLTVSGGNVTFANTSGTNTLSIKVGGAGAVAGVDFDQLALVNKVGDLGSGMVNGLDKLRLSVAIASANTNVLPILTWANNPAPGTFNTSAANVQISGGTATVIQDNVNQRLLLTNVRHVSLSGTLFVIR